MEVRVGDMFVKLMKERKHVQITTMMIIDLLRRAERMIENSERPKPGCASSMLNVVKKYFGLIITDIKDQELRERLTEWIREVETKVEAKFNEIRNRAGDGNESS